MRIAQLANRMKNMLSRWLARLYFQAQCDSITFRILQNLVIPIE